MLFNFLDTRPVEARAAIVATVYENDPCHITVKIHGPMTSLEIVSAAWSLIEYAFKMDQDEGLPIDRIKKFLSRKLRAIRTVKTGSSQARTGISVDNEFEPSPQNESSAQPSSSYPKSSLKNKIAYTTHFITLIHKSAI